MVEYTCEVCGKSFSEEEKELTNSESKCLLHCEKLEDNGWFSYKEFGIEKDWNKSKINKFWNVIQDRLNHAYDDSFYESWVVNNEYILEDIIFPKFQEEVEYDEFSYNVVDLGTNFYSYSTFEHPNNGYEDELNTVFNKLHIVFKNCIFEDCADFEKYQFDNEVKFINCLFNDKVNLPNTLSISFFKSKFTTNLEVHNLKELIPDTRTVFNDCKFSGDFIFNHNYILLEANIFSNCLFNGKIDGRNALFKKRIFNNGWNFQNSEYRDNGYYNIQNIHLTDCIFEDDFLLNDDMGIDLKSIFIELEINSLYFHNSIFKKSVKILNSKIKFPYLYNAKFEGIVDFSNSILGNGVTHMKIDDVVFSFVEFRDIVIFENVKFLNKVNFNRTVFFEYCTFQNSIFNYSVDLVSTIFKTQGNFLNLIADIANRETARIIKNAFDSNNNIIESNKYYSLEMREKKKETKFNKNPFDWLVFNIHGLSSNHSQSWIKALAWIIGIPFILLFLGSVDNINSIVYNIHLKGFWNEIANLINPFSIMIKGETLTFGMLLFKVVIAYLIYQFIVSIRQNTRRK